ncbi:hypothetical protein HMPREF3104_08930 [Corynebacterium sp. HMSC30G07]|nr:hypothetical protein HMPREF3104_08930 [Corynebacterium sp. HMSC30G07]
MYTHRETVAFVADGEFKCMRDPLVTLVIAKNENSFRLEIRAGPAVIANPLHGILLLGDGVDNTAGNELLLYETEEIVQASLPTRLSHNEFERRRFQHEENVLGVMMLHPSPCNRISTKFVEGALTVPVSSSIEHFRRYSEKANSKEGCLFTSVAEHGDMSHCFIRDHPTVRCLGVFTVHLVSEDFVIHVIAVGYKAVERTSDIDLQQGTNVGEFGFA